MKKLLQSLFILLFVASAALAQNRTITGTVTASDDGLPLPGVTVRLKEGTNVLVQTSGNGKFSIKVPSNSKVLVFSFLGYTTQELTIPSGSTMDVVLSPDSKSLNEVVVTAGGLAATKAQLGTASTTIKSDLLTQAKPTNVAAALNGKVAGLQLNVVSSGVNPTYRLTIRGNRSLLGNNQALVVVDNVVVPSSILGNLNPEDIESMEVLNGAGAAALYGSEASNGALVITTKKGKNGVTVYKVANTTNAEKINFYPGLQNSFGSGADADVQIYTAHENQQFGPRFDGSLVKIGDPLEDGSIQTVAYTANDSKNKFWQTGLTNQTDFSMSTGDEKSQHFFSAQYVKTSGTTPNDKYNRFSLRLNGNRDFNGGVSLAYNINYIQNRYDITSVTSSVYDQLLQTPAHILVTQYKDWRNDKFANPNGYYNAYYANPYFSIDNNRQKVRNDYLTGNVELRYKPLTWLNFLWRNNITTQNASNKAWTDKFEMSAYTKSLGLSSLKNNDINGSVSDGSSYTTQLMSEVQVNVKRDLTKDLNLNLTLGSSLRNNIAKGIDVAASGLTFQGLYNIAARTSANITGSESNANTRQQGLYGDLRLSYKNYLYLHATGRNDWWSTLPAANRSIFYPAIDASFILSNYIESLRDNKTINVLKIRGGYSVVGNVNLPAYSLLGTYAQGSGYPYNNVPGYAQISRVVNPNIRPEKTSGYEFGTDVELFKNKVSLSLTYYDTKTDDQIVPVNISSASGYSSYLTNTGKVGNKGIETTLNVVAYRSGEDRGLEISVGGNYAYYDNKVLAISNDLKSLALSTGGTAQVYAVEGLPFPVLQGTGFNRDNQGRVIVNERTGYPSATQTNILFGNTSPKHVLGLNLTAQYKGFRLGAVAQYKGGYVAQMSTGSLDFSGSGIRTVYFDRERFVFPNSSYFDSATNQYVQNTNLTVRDGGAGFWPSSAYNTGIAENYVFNGAYWKITELSLAYDLPKKLFRNSRSVKAVNLMFVGRNLFLFTPKENIFTDPDYMLGNNAIGISTLSQTPPTRFIGGSISVTF
ncbi:SusC/RagA family TonB-linked outer membrane protein [Nubsella zeaxanthinifaciens]|uniref:SusC/RagA family TonB-linked outer membrane protein n=1 Tax=Nubsella zeaxanthinifaciens TaxID=392412 RepID=UPI003D066F6A